MSGRTLRRTLDHATELSPQAHLQHGNHSMLERSMSKASIPTLLLCACSCVAFHSEALAADAADPILGDWSGEIRDRGEAMPFGIHAAKQPGHPPALYFTLSEGKIFKDAGPVYFTLQDDGYKADFLYFHVKMHLAQDEKTLSGTFSFDGNELPFDLARGKLVSE